MAVILEPDLPALKALLRELGLGGSSVVQWPTLARRKGTNMLSCRDQRGDTKDVPVTSEWAARYLDARRTR